MTPTTITEAWNRGQMAKTIPPSMERSLRCTYALGAGAAAVFLAEWIIDHPDADRGAIQQQLMATMEEARELQRPPGDPS